MPNPNPALKTKYSGKGSTKFWKLVNSVPESEGGRELYIMGCLLQDVEDRVLYALGERTKKRDD